MIIFIVETVHRLGYRLWHLRTVNGVAPLGLEIYFERFSTKVSPRWGFYIYVFL
jgi:hypothetical protein